MKTSSPRVPSQIADRAFATPPPLPRSRPVFETPLFIASGVALALFTAARMDAGTLPSIACYLKKWTGIPCPACGGTRCLAACGRLDFAAAFAWNPLVATAACALLAWSVVALFDSGFAGKITALLTPRRLAAIAALNWLYLCWALPR